MIRNLIYHVCPLRGNDYWERNLDQLLARVDVFDGLRVLAVVTDPGHERLHPPELVAERVAGSGCRIIRRQNDKHLREVTTFRPLLDEVCHLGPGNAVFYAHTKGNSTADGFEGATYWRNVMYHELLDKWERCVGLLDRYAAVGTHKMRWEKGQRSPYPSRLQHGNWMFAGTFFWFRAHDAFSHPRWRVIPQDRYGAEAWLSGMFEQEQVKSVFQPWPEPMYPPPSPYDPKLYMRLGCAIADCELKQPSYVI